MAKNSFLRKLGSTMYGAAEGILDAGTFGLSDNLTDTLWTDVVNKGGANNLNQFRGAGNMAGAVGAGFLTGNISGSIEEGLEGFGYLAANSQNEQFQKAEKFANMAAQLSGFAGGANNLTGIGTKMYGLAGNPVVSQPVNQVSNLLSSIPKMPSTNVPKDVVYGNRQSTNYADGGPINPRLSPVFIPAMNPQQFQTMLNSSQPRALTREEMLARVNRPQQNAQESTRNVSSKLVTPEQRAEAFYNSEAEQRKRRLADAEAANKEDLTTSDNWQQLLMRQSQATGDKFHSDYIPDWLNPLVGIGDMASGLGAAPYNIQQGNYGSAALGVLSPVAFGRLASIGAKNTKQFVNNIANPFAGAFDAYNAKREMINSFKKSYGRKADLSDYIASKVPSEPEVNAKPINFIKSLASDADNIENVVKERIAKLRTPEGINRLIQQEKEYLQSIGFDGNLNKQAYNNATARLAELDNLQLVNKDAKTYLKENFHFDDAAKETPFLQNELLFNNAYYSRPPRQILDFDLYGPDLQETVQSGINLRKPSPQLGGKPIIGGKLAIGAPYLKNNPVVHHEFAHALQRGRELPLDRELSLNIRPKNKLTSRETQDYDYFFKGSSGQEPTAFANELRASMLQRGHIKDLYDPINEDVLKNAYSDFIKKPFGTFVKDGKNKYFLSGHRIFDFMEPSGQNFQTLSNLMNKLPSAVPVGVGAVGAAGAANTQIEEYAKGGPIRPKPRPLSRPLSSPIYTSNPNDPRLRRYNDSLTLYNSNYEPPTSRNSYPITPYELQPLINYRNSSEFVRPIRAQYFSDEGYRSDLAFYNANLLSRRSGIMPNRAFYAEGFAPAYKKPVQPIKYADPKIVEKQKLLKEAGLYEGELDGLWGPKSEAAWAEYNKPKPVESKPTTVASRPQLTSEKEEPILVLPRNMFPVNPRTGRLNLQKVTPQEAGSRQRYDASGTPIMANGGPIKSPVIKDYDRDEAPRQGNYLLPDMNRPGYVDTLNQLRTEYRMGINDPRLNKEVLIPTVINGRQFSPDAAVDRYYNTGYHMGMFDTPKQAELASMLRTQKYNTLIDPVRTSPILQFKKGGAVEDPVKPWTVGQPIPGTTKQKISPELQKFLAAEKTKLANQQKLKTAEEQLSRESEMRESLYRRPIGTLPSQNNMLLNALDVATDVGQLGSFVPTPFTQYIGIGSSIIGAGVDAYQALEDVSEDNYAGAFANMASATVPVVLSKWGYKRPMNFINNYNGTYRPLNYLPGATQGQRDALRPFINVNRGILGTLGAEAGYDIYKKGGMIKRADGSYSRRGLWDNIRANRGSGKKPTKQMLEQERKIKAKK